MSRHYNHEIVFGVYLIDSSEKCKTQPYDEIKFRPRENISYNNLLKKLSYCFPIVGDVDFILTCVDEYFCKKRILSTNDLHSAINMIYAKNLYIVYNYEMGYDCENSFPTQFFCNFCCFALSQFRFKCVSCPQYNICARCQENGIHGNHALEYLEIVNSQNNVHMDIFEIKYSRLNMGRKLGEGSFAEIFLGHPIGQPNIKWAIKKLKDCHGIRDSLIKEVKAFEKVGEHENVVKIEGYSKYNQEVLIIMEYVGLNMNGCEITSLYDYLHYLDKLERSNNIVSGKELASFLIQIARGMEHLEAKKIVHRDLAARNILIDHKKFVKISDFGFARDKYYEGNADNVCVLRWAAPEVITSNYYSHKSDVWAFGVVCWEIASLGKKPYDSFSRNQIRNFVLKGHHLERPERVTPLFYRERMCPCWSYKPEERPDFFTIMSKITDFNWMSYD